MTGLRVPGGAWASARKAVAVARLLAANQLAYPGEVAAKALFVSVMMFIVTSLWRAVGEHHDVPAMTGMTIPQLIWYLAFTEAMYVSFSPVPDGLAVDREVRSGEIAYRLARPMGYATYHLAAHLGERSATFALKLMVTSAVALVLVGLPPLSPVAVAAALAAALLGFVADAAWMHAIAFVSFWVEDTYGLYLLYRRSMMLLGGLLIPLSAYPEWLRRVAEALPFRLILAGPARLFVAADAGGFLRLAGLQLAFALAGVAVMALVCRAGLRRASAQGG